VSVNRWHEAEAHSSANRLCNLALVDRSQTSLFSVSNAAQSSHVLGHDGEVLESGTHKISNCSSCRDPISSSSWLLSPFLYTAGHTL